MTFQIISILFLGPAILLAISAYNSITTDFTLKINATVDEKEAKNFRDAMLTQLAEYQLDDTTTTDLTGFFFNLVEDDNILCAATNEEMRTLTTLLGLLGTEILLRQQELRLNPLTEFAENLLAPKNYTTPQVNLQKIAALHNGKYTCKRLVKFMGTPVFSVSW
jgi:hypothetical protein